LGDLGQEGLAQLAGLGLADSDSRKLTMAGEIVDDAYWVRHRPEDAVETLRVCLLKATPIQILLQGLHGKGAVPIAGALHLLMKHRLAKLDDLSRLRVQLLALNPIGIIKYSPKHQTVRSSVSAFEAEESPAIRVIEPDRPYSNRRHIRSVLHDCREFVWWADPHFSKRGLEFLHDDVDAALVKEVRILSGRSEATAAIKDYVALRTELSGLGITISWRLAAEVDRKWHDRYILTKEKVWNVPPLNTLLSGDYSEIILTSSRPPFEEWWKLAAELSPLS